MSSLVMARVQADFLPQQQDYVLHLLRAYGVRYFEREPERVHMAILQMAQGEPERVRQLVRSAKWDYRDVLYWASKNVAEIS